jgi:predicted O-linked N-acetylglucosamine transferase (SPINDLY family)
MSKQKSINVIDKSKIKFDKSKLDLANKMWGNDNKVQECFNIIKMLVEQCMKLSENQKMTIITEYIQTFIMYAELCCKFAGGIQNGKTQPFTHQETQLMNESIGSLKIVLDKDPFHTRAIELYKIICLYFSVNIDDKKLATAILKNVLIYQPLDFQIHFNLALIYQKDNDLDTALIHFKTSCEILEKFLKEKEDVDKETKTELTKFVGKCYNSIGSIYFYSQNREMALIYFKKGLLSLPNDPDLYNQIGVTYTELRFVDKAIEAYLNAIKYVDNSSISDKVTLLSSIHMNMGLSRCYECDFVKGIECYNTALKYKPDLSLAFQNKLLDLNYISHLIKDPMYIANLHKKINNIYQKVITNYKESIPNYIIKNPKLQKIRIGFVSGDFICHPVSYFLSSILQNINYDKFEIYCFTIKVQQLGDLYPKCKWFIAKTLSSKDLAKLITDNGIDMLFDMSGQTGDNRLDTFALKPAPIQISYCGYPGTTGLNSMDYHLTDSYCDSENTQKYYVEKLVFLKNCFLNYNPPMDIIEFPKKLIQPFIKNGYITFGTFNRFNKINPRLIGVWEQILEKIPTCRFIIKTKEFLSPHLIEKFFNSFKNKNLIDRIEILDYSENLLTHLPDYNLMDIALDSFPYSGTTTSCEALYMGVPLITLFDSERGYHSQNVTTSLLKNSNLSEFVATDIPDYINKAVTVSQKDKNYFTNLKIQTREKFMNSPIWKREAFIQNFEETLTNLYINHPQFK